MGSSNTSRPEAAPLFEGARQYDESINWSARFGREIPVFERAFGPPAAGGIVDAGCGPGRHAVELARRGYRVVGVDASEEMLALARRRSEVGSGRLSFALATYADMFETIGGGFDGLYCVGNSLAAAGSAEACAEAIRQFGLCLRPGGRMVVQILNFKPMRSESPCVRGPRVTRADGREYVSVRQFHFSGESVQVTNITLFDDGGWRQRSSSGMLHAIRHEALRTWCAAAHLGVNDTWGDYAGTPFDEEQSTDLIVTATKELGES